MIGSRLHQPLTWRRHVVTRGQRVCRYLQRHSQSPQLLRYTVCANKNIAAADTPHNNQSRTHHCMECIVHLMVTIGREENHTPDEQLETIHGRLVLLDTRSTFLTATFLRCFCVWTSQRRNCAARPGSIAVPNVHNFSHSNDCQCGRGSVSVTYRRQN